MSELKEITALMLEIIESKLPAPSSFNLWFGNFELISLTEEKAIFKTPTNLRKSTLLKRYKDIISDALESVIGFQLEIEITAPENFSEVVTIDDPEPIIPPKTRDEERIKEINNIINNTPTKEEYTFENFVEGDSNKFVKAICLGVAKFPTCYNPLFIHGHSGLGKTHLLFAVLNEMRKTHPSLKIVYTTCEDFMNEMIESIAKD